MILSCYYVYVMIIENDLRPKGTVNGHITYGSGRRKTVGASSVLAHFGIYPDTYKYAENINDINRILRDRGYSVRSRKSKIVTKKANTLGSIRNRIKDSSEPGKYFVRVPGHAMLLDGDGKTIVDTDPRKRDRRKVTHVYKIEKNYG